MDHSASSFPEHGIMDSDSAVDAAIKGGADAIVMHKGAVSHHFARTLGADLSAMHPYPPSTVDPDPRTRSWSLTPPRAIPEGQ